MTEIEGLRKMCYEVDRSFNELVNHLNEVDEVDIVLDLLEHLTDNFNSVRNQIKHAKEVELHESLPKDHVCTCFM